MQMNKYQKEASKTAIYPKEYKVYYPTLMLCAESGELGNKIGKVMRGDGELAMKDALWKNREDYKKELGDVLWYLSQLATDMGYDLNDIAKLNIKKLRDRQKRNKIKGTGDER